MALIKFVEQINERKINSNPINNILQPIKANKEIRAINHYFLNAISLIKRNKTNSFASPFSLFNQKTPNVNPLNISLAQPSAIIDKISAFGQVKQPENPMQGFIKSLSAAAKLETPKSSPSFQFSSQIIESVQENIHYKTLRIKRPPDWQFLPGQYLEIRAENSSSSKPAVLAIASGVYDDYIEITAKPNSNPNHASSCMNCLPGEYLTITGPLGTNFPVDAITPETPVLVLGGGSGLTALKSLMESLPYGTDTRLIYSSKTVDELLYRDEIEKWKEQGHTISLTRDHVEGFEQGRITEHLNKIELKPNTLVFICGPTELILQTAKQLVEMGVPREMIFGSLPVPAKDGGPIFRGDHPRMMSANIA